MSTIDINGGNVNRVEFGGADERLGTLRQVGRKRWIEDSVVDGPHQFEFSELRRGPSTVDLYDESRNVTMRIDLAAKTLLFGSGQVASVPIYVVTDATARAHGWTVNRIEFGRNGERLGLLRQLADDSWVEDSEADGPARFQFVEEARDDWSVFLLDSGRDLRLQIDLHTEKVLIRTPEGESTTLYDVLRATDDITGWRVDLVEVGPGEVTTGILALRAEGEWVETDAAREVELFDFVEVERADRAITLHDQDRDISLLVDLEARQVLHGPGRRPESLLYNVIVATDDAQPPTPDPGPEAVTGLDVNRVEFGPRRAVTGVLRQIDQTTWVEDSVDTGRDRYEFNEIGRDGATVQLHDPSRGIAVEIDMQRSRVRVGVGRKASRKLGNVLTASAEITPWLLTSAKLSHGASLSKIDWNTWALTEGDSLDNHHFDEVGRDDWSLYLVSAEGDSSLQVDLYTRTATRRVDGESTTEWSIESVGAHDSIWADGESISSLCRLTTEIGDVPDEWRKVYRSTVSVSPETRWVKIKADTPTRVRIGDEVYEVDDVRSATVEPNALSAVVVSVPAMGIESPALKVRTNRMKETNWHIIRPDEDVLRKLHHERPGCIKRRLRERGALDRVGAANADAVESTMRGLAALVQRVDTPLPTGPQLDRVIRRKKIRTPNFAIDLRDPGAPKFETLTREQASERVGAATPIEAPIGLMAGGPFPLLQQLVTVMVNAASGKPPNLTDLTTSHTKTVQDHLFPPPQRPSRPRPPAPQPPSQPQPPPSQPTVTVVIGSGDDRTRFDIDDAGDVLRLTNMIISTAGDQLEAIRDAFVDNFDLGPIFSAHDLIYDAIERGLTPDAANLADLRTTIGGLAFENESPVARPPSGKTSTHPANSRHRDDATKEAIDKVNWFFDKLTGGAQRLIDEIEEFGEKAVEEGRRVVEQHLPGVDLFTVMMDQVTTVATTVVTPQLPDRMARPRPAVAMPARVTGAAGHSPDPANAVISRQVPSAPPPAIATAFERIRVAVEGGADEIADAVSALVGAIERAVGSGEVDPEAIVGALLNIVVEVGEGLMDVLVALLHALVDAAEITMSLVKKAVFEPLPEVPVISDIYREHSGRGPDLTVAGIVAFAGSVPALAVFQTATGQRSMPAGIAALDPQPTEVVIRGSFHCGFKVVYGVLFTAAKASTNSPRASKTVLQLAYLLAGTVIQVLEYPIPPGVNRQSIANNPIGEDPHAAALLIWRVQFFSLLVLPALEMLVRVGGWQFGWFNSWATSSAVSTFNPRTGTRTQSAAAGNKAIDAIFAALSAIFGIVFIVLFSFLAGADEHRRLALNGNADRTEDENVILEWGNGGWHWVKLVTNLVGCLALFAPAIMILRPGIGTGVGVGSSLLEGLAYAVRIALSANY